MKKLAILLLAVSSLMIASCAQSVPDKLIKLADQAEAKGDKWSQEKWEEVATEFGDLLDQFSAKEDDYGMMKKLRVLGATTKFYAAATKYVVAPEAKAKIKGLTDDNDESVEGEEGEGEALEGLDKAISETADNIADALKGLGF